MIAIRGAVTIENVEKEELLEATAGMLETIVEKNGLSLDCIVAAHFTVTPDIQVAFPAEAARRIGWSEIALIDAVEIDVPGALAKCIRVMVLAEKDRTHKPVHAYLGKASILRPDLVSCSCRPGRVEK